MIRSETQIVIIIAMKNNDERRCHHKRFKLNSNKNNRIFSIEKKTTTTNASQFKISNYQYSLPILMIAVIGLRHSLFSYDRQKRRAAEGGKGETRRNTETQGIPRIPNKYQFRDACCHRICQSDSTEFLKVKIKFQREV